MNARLESPPAQITKDTETEDFTQPAARLPLFAALSEALKCNTDSTASCYLPQLTLNTGGNVWSAFDSSASRMQTSGYCLPNLEIDCSPGAGSEATRRLLTGQRLDGLNPPRQLFTAFDAPLSIVTTGDGALKQGAAPDEKVKEEAKRAGEEMSKMLGDILKNGVPGIKPGTKQDPIEVTAPKLLRPELRQPPASGELDVLRQFPSRSTSYYPHNSRMQGGFWDRKGYELFTLQAYLRGEAPYVSVAMDSKVAKYGTQIRIPELEEKYGRPIDFRLVDTGGRFKGRGTQKIDICSETKRDAYRPEVNKTLSVQFVKREGAPDIYDIPRRHRGRR